MSLQNNLAKTHTHHQDEQLITTYLETLSMVERLHRLLLDVIKDEFERLGLLDINSVQALLLFNIGNKEVTAGELRTRGYYQGSNVSYNLKKLVEAEYIEHKRCASDRRSVRVKLSEKGQAVRKVVLGLFVKHSKDMSKNAELGMDNLKALNSNLENLERYWGSQIRYIY